MPGPSAKETFKDLFADAPDGQWWFEQAKADTPGVDRTLADLAAELLRPLAPALRKRKTASTRTAWLAGQGREAERVRGANKLLDGDVSTLSVPALLILLDVTQYELVTRPSAGGHRQRLVEFLRDSEQELEALDRQLSRVREAVELHRDELATLRKELSGT